MSDRVDVVTPNDIFWKLVATAQKTDITSAKGRALAQKVLALDPGETTGICRWDMVNFHLSQLETKDIGQAFNSLSSLVDTFDPDHIRCEEYRVYAWMADSHSWAVLHTPQLIGAIKVLASLRDIPLSFKLAQQAKAFWNDDNLKLCGLYSPGLKHARDALRHLLYYITFPDRVD